jgi:hypothetical protein
MSPATIFPELSVASVPAQKINPPAFTAGLNG